MSVVHSTFNIDRTYSAPPSRVFAAFADQATKRRWFAEGEGWGVEEFSLDFRVGGRESSSLPFKDGPEVRNHTVFQDILPDQRIIFVYAMTVGDQRISASLSTVELITSGKRTKLLFTEQAAFLEAADGPDWREAGWRELFESLAKAIS